MNYKNGKDVLPPELLTEVQKHLCGEMLYIPKRDEMRASWGQLSGLREQVYTRNVQIVNLYDNGATVTELIRDFCLSEASIRKIIYNHRSKLKVKA
ncbi:MAG: hypothetical protein LBS19_01375 [Clostridiales bacterium]|nr:hypothetical protein [Clostridiales bacterium]